MKLFCLESWMLFRDVMSILNRSLGYLIIDISATTYVVIVGLKASAYIGYI